MRCPYCGYYDSKVVDSRSSDDGASIRRRRECFKCAKRFTTYENCEQLPLFVIKRSGEKKLFDIQKVISSVSWACAKRGISKAKIENLAKGIEHKLRTCGKYEVFSALIGEYIMEELRRIDFVSYLRFASMCKDFKDADAFLKELESFKGQ